MLSLKSALVVLALGGGNLSSEGQPEEPESHEAEMPDPPAEVEDPGLPIEEQPPTPPPSTARPGSKIRPSRGWLVPDERLRKRVPPPPSGNIHLHNLYRRESLKMNIFNRDGSYNADALKALSRLLRCKRTDLETPIEPRLFTILSHVYDRFGERRIEVTSGYRNQLRTTSNHYRGSATDIHVQGVNASDLSAFLDTLDAGGMGVGLYPTGRFRARRRAASAELPLDRLLADRSGRSESAPASRLEDPEETPAELIRRGRTSPHRRNSSQLKTPPTIRT